jgi:hypothetical protein
MCMCIVQDADGWMKVLAAVGLVCVESRFWEKRCVVCKELTADVRERLGKVHPKTGRERPGGGGSRGIAPFFV